MTGYFQVPRGLFSNPAFGRGEFDRYHAFVWLVEKAAWRDTKIDVMGRTVLVARGQFCCSIRDIAETWGWTKDKVDRFLDRLETETLISRSVEASKTIISITEYDTYQGGGHHSELPSSDLFATAPRHDRDTNTPTKEEDNNLINKESLSAKKPFSAEFSVFWQAYPEKVAKPKAMQSFAKARKIASLEEILAGLERYKANKPCDRSWAHPTTWLNQERWTDGEPPAPALPLLGLAVDNTKPRAEEFDEEAYRWRNRCQMHFVRGMAWDTGWGPAPGQRWCEVPKHILDEFPQFAKSAVAL